jgi:hypothetical protein
MRFDPNVVFLGELHCRAHVIEVGGVKATGDIGDVDREAPDAETLAHVAIQEDHQRLRHSRVNKVTKTGAIVKSVAPRAELVSRPFAETIRIRTVARRSKLSSDCVILAHAGAHIRKALFCPGHGPVKRRHSPNA